MTKTSLILSQRRQEFAVVNGNAFDVNAVEPSYAFKCPEGSRYINHSEALVIAGIVNSHAYTPWGSWNGISGTPTESHNKGLAVFTDAEGTLNNAEMFTEPRVLYTNTTGYRVYAKPGTQTSLSGTS